MTPPPLILSEENKRRMSEWFGPDEANWKGKQVEVYREKLHDADGNVIGETIGVRLPTCKVEGCTSLALWGIINREKQIALHCCDQHKREIILRLHRQRRELPLANIQVIKINQ